MRRVDGNNCRWFETCPMAVIEEDDAEVDVIIPSINKPEVYEPISIKDIDITDFGKMLNDLTDDLINKVREESKKEKK